jgi:cell fate regulator YaaT (PSP1 superfamily)
VNLIEEEVKLIAVVLRKETRTYFLAKPDFQVKLFDKVIVDLDGELKHAIVKKTLVKMDKKRWDIIRAKGFTGKIIRIADAKDIARLEKLEEKEQDAFRICKQKIKEYNLPMHLVQTVWDESEKKYIFYFTADSRIDFRELVKALIKTFNRKIQLWQVGARDAMRLLGGCGPCGFSLCCTAFLDELESVELIYAKMQNLPPNPAKITGSCGKLVCCLRYELDI